MNLKDYVTSRSSRISVFVALGCLAFAFLPSVIQPSFMLLPVLLGAWICSKKYILRSGTATHKDIWFYITSLLILGSLFPDLDNYIETSNLNDYARFQAWNPLILPPTKQGYINSERIPPEVSQSALTFFLAHRVKKGGWVNDFWQYNFLAQFLFQETSEFNSLARYYSDKGEENTSKTVLENSTEECMHKYEKSILQEFTNKNIRKIPERVSKTIKTEAATPIYLTPTGYFQFCIITNPANREIIIFGRT